MAQDVRWIQRFDNYCKAFQSLQEAVRLSEERALSKLEEQGLIQAFEFTFELAWKTLKDYLESVEVDAKFPRDVVKTAFKYDLIDNGEIWMDMLEKRNLMAHTYDETKAHTAVNLIISQYFNQLSLLEQLFQKKVNE